MEPYEAINLLEVILRDLIRSELGTAWIDSFSSEDVARLEAKREEEAKKRSGSIVRQDLLDYTEFTQIQRVISKHHETFAPALGRKRDVEDTWRRLNGLRNPTMHSRDLLPFERDLLSGLVGEIRNQVTLYRSAEGPDMEYYPVIESITDSFGRVRSTAQPFPQRTEPRPRVHPGDTIVFQCRATDPQDRDLEWSATDMRGLTVGVVSGTDVELHWQVNENQVNEQQIVFINLTSSGKFHRRGQIDDQLQFDFSVNPPREM